MGSSVGIFSYIGLVVERGVLFLRPFGCFGAACHLRRFLGWASAPICKEWDMNFQELSRRHLWDAVFKPKGVELVVADAVVGVSGSGVKAALAHDGL